MEARGTNTDDVKLLALASGRRLYQGIPDEEIRNGFPFMFFDYGFAYPLQALQRIYPTGLKSVPEIETETPVVLEKQILTTLVVKRLSNDKVQYKLVMPMMTIKGFVEKERKPALPDNYELDRWKDETLRGYATLGEARVNRD